MTDTFLTPEELDSNNSIENNNNNLQNNSEENTRESNTEKKSPIHDPGMIERMIEEGTNKESQTTEQTDDTTKTTRKRDPRVWEESSGDDEDNSEENQEQENTDTNAKGKKRYSKRNNTRIANLKRTKEQKEKKLARLGRERDAKKGDISRGYLIVHLNDDESDTEHIKHVHLDVADKEIIKAVIAEREDEIFDLNEEIQKIDSDILALASAKKSSYRDRLSKKRKNKNEYNLVKRVDKELSEASKNGSKEIVSEIQQHIQTGNKNEAYKSLKSFLSQQVKTVAKKLDKSDQLEKNVIGRVLDNLGKSQS